MIKLETGGRGAFPRKKYFDERRMLLKTRQRPSTVRHDTALYQTNQLRSADRVLGFPRMLKGAEFNSGRYLGRSTQSLMSV
jgi:hypothetical protein